MKNILNFLAVLPNAFLSFDDDIIVVVMIIRRKLHDAATMTLIAFPFTDVSGELVPYQFTVTVHLIVTKVAFVIRSILEFVQSVAAVSLAIQEVALVATAVLVVHGTAQEQSVFERSVGDDAAVVEADGADAVFHVVPVRADVDVAVGVAGLAVAGSDAVDPLAVVVGGHGVLGRFCVVHASVSVRHLRRLVV